MPSSQVEKPKSYPEIPATCHLCNLNHSHNPANRQLYAAMLLLMLAPAIAGDLRKNGVSECSYKSMGEILWSVSLPFRPATADTRQRLCAFGLLLSGFPPAPPRLRSPHLVMATSFTISSTHLRSNSTSPNRLADWRARRRTDSGSGRDSAFSKPSANSSAVEAWNPGLCG